MGVAVFGVVFEALGALSAFGAKVQRDCQDRSHQSCSDDFEDRIDERDGESLMIDS